MCVWTSAAAAETSLDAADANTCPLWRHREANVQAELPADSHCSGVDDKLKEGDTWMSECVHVWTFIELQSVEFTSSAHH